MESYIFREYIFTVTPENIVRSVSTDRTCKVGAITEGNIPDEKKSCYRIYCPDILKACQRETKLLEFSGDTNKEELKIIKKTLLCNGFVAMASLEWFHCTGYGFPFSVCLCLQKKLPSFLTTVYTGNYRLVVKDLQATKIGALAVQSFS